MSRQEVVLPVLGRAVQADLEAMMPLFGTPHAIEKATPGSLPFTFIDLFAGIGGFRSALQHLGGRCLFSSEWDKYSQKTYKAWYGETPHGDIREIAKMPSEIPDHDVLAAGFPCQPFSIAGVSKRQSLGMAHGFECATQGNLFFQLAAIVNAKRPPVLFLENVKNLQSHDQGRTWNVISETLKDLNYWVFPQVIDAAGWVPQHRERVYLVCFDKKEFPQKPPFEFPSKPQGKKPRLQDILEPDPDPKYTLTEHLWNYLQRYAEGHRAKGNGFGFGLVDPESVSRTLSARYYKDGSEILIPQGPNKPPRRLTPKECARLMGFDERYQNHIVVSDTQAYKQFGNAVVPKVVEAVGRQIVRVLAQIRQPQRFETTWRGIDIEIR
jgi:DNA (cytosine-5)-methyltransferase 1